MRDIAIACEADSITFEPDPTTDRKESTFGEWMVVFNLADFCVYTTELLWSTSLVKYFHQHYM